MGYMVAPLGLTERQLLIYNCLYKKCDFDNMTVKCTTSQIVEGIRIIDLSIKVVNSELRKMIELGFLKVVKRGSRGNCSQYKIVKQNEIIEAKEEVSIRQVKGKLKCSNSNACDNTEVSIRQVKGNPISKNKEKDNIYIDEIWSLYPKKQGKAVAVKKIHKIINDIGKDKLIGCIRNYIEYVEVTRKNSFNLEYMNGSTFFNGRYLDFMEKQKEPIGVGSTNKKTNYNDSICNNQNKYTQGCKIY